MKKILSLLQPFSFKQQIYVYEDGNKLDAIEASYEEFNDKILSLAQTHGINKIEFLGPKQYSKGIAKKILEENLSKYNIEKIEIDCK